MRTNFRCWTAATAFDYAAQVPFGDSSPQLGAAICRVLVFATFASACGGADANEIYVRLKNDSAFNFDTLQMFVAGDAEFGSLRGGETSEYQVVEFVHEFEGGSASAQGLLFFGMVTDHVGDTLLGNGFHTFSVGAQLGSALSPVYSGYVFFTHQ